MATTQSDSDAANKYWLKPWLILLFALVAWNAVWLTALSVATKQNEFTDDVPAIYEEFLADPSINLSDRHRKVYGASVAAPGLPLEIAAADAMLTPRVGAFLMYRLTFAACIIVGTMLGFAVAFRRIAIPISKRDWLCTFWIAIVPVGWVGSTIMAQDDSFSTLWSGVALLAYSSLGPVAATVASGFGIFFGKPLMVINLLGIWIASAGRRWLVTAVGGAIVLAFAAFLFWRDGTNQTSYNVPSFMGPNPFGILHLLGVEIDPKTTRSLSAILILLSTGIFTLFALRQKLSFVAASCGLYSLFLAFYLGAMPEYEMWYLPLVIVALWGAVQQQQWLLFWTGWLHSFFANAYKVLYGFNQNFETAGKSGLKNWYAQNIGWDLQWLQILMAVATVGCAIAFAVLLLRRDPTKSVTPRP